MRALDLITQILLIVGGLNWLLVGAFRFDLVAALFGGQDSPCRVSSISSSGSARSGRSSASPPGLTAAR